LQNEQVIALLELFDCNACTIALQRGVRISRASRYSGRLRRREVAKHDATTALLFTGEEIARLKEFVDLCERLQRLKRDAVLDALANTIIKLAARLSAVHPH